MHRNQDLEQLGGPENYHQAGFGAHREVGLTSLQADVITRTLGNRNQCDTALQVRRKVHKVFMIDCKATVDDALIK